MSTLEWVERDGRLALRVTGAAPAVVYPALDAAVAPSLLQPMAGEWQADASGGAVVFVPRYPFVAGTDYVVAAAGERRTIHLAAERAAPVTSVVAIRPAVDEVPRNLLRLYVEFSGPMSEGLGSRCVRLLDGATGARLEAALLPMEPELWDPTRRRLTVLLDPARIKRGLAPHLEAGYPLVEGRSIEVVVDESFLDAAGRPLVAPARRRYRVGGDLRGHVDPDRWRVDASPGALRVGFDRPLDVALLARCLVPVDGEGRPVAGLGDAADDGRSWSFVAAGTESTMERLRVDPILEDVAGNSVSRVFDRDLDEPADDSGPTEARFVVLPSQANVTPTSASSARSVKPSDR